MHARSSPNPGRSTYREDSLGWALIGVIGLLAALGLLLDPSGTHASAAQRELHGTWQVIWNVGWAIGGALISWGVLTCRPRTELIGQMFFGVAVLIDAIALATIPNPPVPGTATAVIAFIFCAVRARFLARRLQPRTHA